MHNVNVLIGVALFPAFWKMKTQQATWREECGEQGLPALVAEARDGLAVRQVPFRPGVNVI